MSITLDEIYESFIWDKSYSDEEYAAKVAVGINEGTKYKYIYPFIQPIIPEIGKALWEPCAKIVASKSDNELKPYLILLFEWLQDMNWPGAWTIFDRLLQIPFSDLEKEYDFCRNKAEREKDDLWLMALDDFKEQVEV